MIELLASNPIVREAFLLLLFGAVAASAYFGTHRVAARHTARRRLLQPAGGHSPATSGRSLRTESVHSAWLKLVNSIEARGLDLSDTKDIKLRQRLVAAGFEAPFAPRIYTLIRLVLVVLLPMSALALMWALGFELTLTKLYLVLVTVACIGLYAPAYFVRIRANRRQQELANAFPDALDLMLICVEAGLSLESSFARVGMEMTSSHPRIAEEFGAVVLELRAGRSHEDAFRRMADRAASDDIRAFATLLIQSTKLGSSIAQTLRIYSAEMRQMRRLRAEERAHRLPVLISIPLVTCMLPTMIGVLMLPVVIRVIRTVLPALHGG